MFPEVISVPYKMTRVEIACFLAPGQLGYNLYLNNIAFKRKLIWEQTGF